MSLFAEWFTKQVEASGIKRAELARGAGVSAPRISQIAKGVVGAREYIPSPELLAKLASVIAPKLGRAAADVRDEWQRLIELDAFKKYCPTLNKSDGIPDGFNARAMSAVVQYARGMLAIRHPELQGEDMHFIRLSELPTERKVFLTENPKDSIVTDATLIVCVNRQPEEGKWCLALDENRNARLCKYAPGMEKLWQLFSVVQCMQ